MIEKEETPKDENTDSVTFRCLRCDRRFTYYGEQARMLIVIETQMRKYRQLMSKQIKTPYVPTILNIVGAQSKCCEMPLILNTYPEKGEY